MALALQLHDHFATIAPLLRSGDPLMAGGDSPALERYRNARASLAELELGRQRNELVDREAYRQLVSGFLSVLRETFEDLQRQFGASIYDQITEAIDEAERRCEAAFAGAATVDGGNRPKEHAP